MTYEYETFSEAWFGELGRAMNEGEESSPRGMKTSELRWRQFSVKDPMTFPVAAKGRTFRDAIGVLEAVSLVGQFSVPELFTSRFTKFGDFLDDGVFHGAYATRAHGALGELVSLLTADPDSRQGVISVFDSTRDLNRAKRDIPCTVALHFMRRGQALELNVTMRSNDLWLGTPYDFTQFGVLQASIAQALGLVPGLYVHSVGSLHLYERDLGSALRVLRPEQGPSLGFPLWHADDIAGITKRARDLALAPDFFPRTGFEAWAWSMLHG
jgi:thymidylate synthase